MYRPACRSLDALCRQDGMGKAGIGISSGVGVVHRLTWTVLECWSPLQRISHQLVMPFPDTFRLNSTEPRSQAGTNGTRRVSQAERAISKTVFSSTLEPSRPARYPLSVRRRCCQAPICVTKNHRSSCFEINLFMPRSVGQGPK